MNCKSILSLVVLLISLIFGGTLYYTRSKGPSGYGYITTAEEISINTDLTGKVAIVTGANSGIGLETARILSLRGAHVFVAARSISKAQQSIKEILSQLPPDPPFKSYKLSPLSLDLASLATIQRVVEEFKALNIPLHILVANAATYSKEVELTEDGFESQIGVNHLGHFFLVNLLMDKLVESQPSRVIIVSSYAYSYSNVSNLNDPEFRSHEYDPFLTYAFTKLSNVIHARELNERFSSKGVTSYSLHPGSILTPLSMKALSFVIRLLVFPFFKTVEQGTATTIYATLKAPIEQSGNYFSDSNMEELKEPYKTLVEDPEVRKKFWEKSEKLIQEKLQQKNFVKDSQPSL